MPVVWLEWLPGDRGGPAANALPLTCWSVSRVKSFFAVGIFCICACMSPTIMAADAQASSEDILYLGDRPVLLRLQLVVDGKPWSEVRRSLVLRQFDLLDADDDGLLLMEQIEGLPLTGFNPEDPDSWDTEVQDGKLSQQEFVELFGKFGQPRFLLAEGDSQAASRVQLFSHLDADGDGKLTSDEFAQAKHRLARLDYDDDETISTTELAPFVNPLFQQATLGREQPFARQAPFVAVGSFATRHDLAVALLRRYSAPEHIDKERDADDASEETLRCKPQVLGSEERTASFDENHDGLLDPSEVARYLAALQPDVELQIELPSRSVLRPKIKLLADEISASASRPSRIRGSSRLPLKAGNTGFDLRVLSSLAKSNDNRNFYLLEFRRADQDKNTYLDASEFPGVGLNVAFDQVDGDADGKVVRDELLAYLERDAFVAQSQVVMSVAADSRTLFKVFDQNQDQRLTAREFQEMEERAKYLDRNGDGTVELGEMAHEYRLMFSMGRPRVFQQAMSMQPNNRTPVPRATPDTQAPDWFRKMDRNQDGDLSWREFLGKRATFDRLDKDSDGLITAAEFK